VGGGGEEKGRGIRSECMSVWREVRVQCWVGVVGVSGLCCFVLLEPTQGAPFHSPPPPPLRSSSPTLTQAITRPRACIRVFSLCLSDLPLSLSL